MERPAKFYKTEHFLQRLLGRAISYETAKDVVIYHQKFLKQGRGGHNGFIHRFEKTVDGKTLVVVAEIKKDECWFITVFFQDGIQ